MPETSESGDTTQAKKRPKTKEELVKQVAERVWELWREDLRRERERAGTRAGR